MSLNSSVEAGLLLAEMALKFLIGKQAPGIRSGQRPGALRAAGGSGNRRGLSIGRSELPS